MLQANKLIAQAQKAFDRQDWRGAVELYKEIPSKADFPYSDKFNYFRALEHAGQPDQAKSGYTDLSYRNPLNIDAHMEAGLFFQRQEKADEAAIFFGRALCVDAEAEPALRALEKQDIYAQEKIDHYCILGGLAGENFMGKRPSFIVEILIFPLVSKAMAAMRKQAWQEAEAALGKILKIVPNYVAMLVQLGHCLREQSKLEEALTAYRWAILLSPRDADIYLHLGHTLKAMERHLSALNAYSTVLTLRPCLHDAEREVETRIRFLHSRGIHIASNQPEPQDVRPVPPPPQSPAGLTPESWLSDRQKIIFNQLSNALTVRD